MRVLHIFHSLRFSGAEIMYVDAAKVFQDNGCELSAVATADELGEFAEKFKAQGYMIYHIPYPPKSSPIARILYVIRFSSFLKKNSIDIIHIHASKTMFGMALAAWLAGKKSLRTFHNVFPTRTTTMPFHILQRYIVKHLFKCKFHTISDSVYNNELNIFKNNTIQIDNWYGSNRFFPAEQSEKLECRKHLGILEDSFVIISVGGCSPIKRHSDILKALAIVKKTIPNCLYLHLGQGDSLKEEKTLAKTLGLQENVLFMGNQYKVRDYLVASDVYVMPSKFEGISISTVEAMGCEIPAILYDVPGLRDFNKNMVTCELIEEDYHILAKELIAFHLNPGKADALAKAAKNNVNSRYDMMTNVNKIFELYNT